jgi:hypothetical protein
MSESNMAAIFNMIKFSSQLGENSKCAVGRSWTFYPQIVWHAILFDGLVSWDKHTGESCKVLRENSLVLRERWDREHRTLFRRRCGEWEGNMRGSSKPSRNKDRKRRRPWSVCQDKLIAMVCVLVWPQNSC